MIDYDKIASEYSLHRKVNLEVLKSLIKEGNVNSDSKVLEVGCGTGNYITAIEELTGASCWGIDPSRMMLSKAEERSKKVKFKLGRAEKIEFPDNFFNLVFSVDVIHHVKDRLAYFHEAYRVLKKRGKVCTVTDSEWIIRHREPLSIYFPETVNVELERYPRIAELRSIILQAGFSEILENIAEFAYELTDIQAYRDKTFSSLHLISKEAFQRGIKRMEEDLLKGPIRCVSRYLLLWGVKP